MPYKHVCLKKIKIASIVTPAVTRDVLVDETGFAVTNIKCRIAQSKDGIVTDLFKNIGNEFCKG